ncbi:MAG: outer membrane protein transport protein [Deltaproteobacteria bacterium]|nr:MAG: outer membrane protein transport protein [Deltaproteobacteria bacterium]
MKKLFTFLGAVGLVFFLISSVSAGGIDNKQNFSAEYLRTFSRNAATDAADVVAYNPAGVMKLEDGGYVNLAIFYALKDYSNTIQGVEYESDEPSIIPGLFGVYKTEKWAAFAAFTIPAGGGKVEYDRGSATTFSLASQIIAGSGGAFNAIYNQRLEANSYYYGYTLGGAYEVNEMVSVSLGVRYIDATKEAKGSVSLGSPLPALDGTIVDLEYEETADGWGGFAGVNITPTEEWNIGIRFETNTKLDFETKVKTQTLPAPLLTQGEKLRRDLPGLLGVGVGYTITPKILVEASYTYYLEKNATWEDRATTPRDESKGGDSYDLGIALTYTFNPQLKGSVGYMLTDTGINPDDMLPEAAELDAQTVCGGILYEVIPGLNLNFALQHTFYEEGRTSTGIIYKKDITGLGFGIQYKF